MIGFLVVALWLACGGCSDPAGPVEDPVEIPAYVGHYASDTTEICYDSGVCVLWNASIDLYEDDACAYRVSATDQDPAGQSVVIESVQCTYSVHGLYLFMGGRAVATYGDGTQESGEYYLDMWANKDWTQLQWYDLVLERA